MKVQSAVQMKPEVPIQVTAEDFYGRFSNLDHFMGKEDGCEIYQPNFLNKTLGNGFFYILKCRPGLVVNIFNWSLHRPVLLDFDMHSRFFYLFFCQSRNLAATFNSQVGGAGGIDFNTLQGDFFYAPSYCGSTLYQPVPFCGIQIIMSSEFLEPLLSEESSFFPVSVSEMLFRSDTADNCGHHSVIVSPEMHRKIEEVFGCRYSGGSRRFFLESRVIDLIIRSLTQLSIIAESSHTCFPVKTEDPCTAAAGKARDIMMNNMHNPPSLTELSRQIEAAAKAACCHDFITRLPQGYQTVVSEGGSSLSGGEKQRISIARAILKNAPIVLLDEATASLDPENEADIQYAIENLVKGRTIVVIDHRFRSIIHADQILVIDDGKVADSGTHSELIEKKGLYKTLWEKQQRAGTWKL